MAEKKVSSIPEEECFIDLLTTIGLKTGLKAPMAKVIGLLHAQTDEISLDELSLKTGYSLATISNILKDLEFLNFAQRTKKPGDKKVYVIVEKNSLTLFQQQIRIANRVKFAPLKRDIPPLVQALKNRLKNAVSKEEKELIKKKIVLYQNYYNQALWFEENFNHMNDMLEKEKKKFDL